MPFFIDTPEMRKLATFQGKPEPEGPSDEELKQLASSFAPEKVESIGKDDYGNRWGVVVSKEGKKYIPIKNKYTHEASGKEYVVTDTGTLYRVKSKEEIDDEKWRSLILKATDYGVRGLAVWEGAKFGAIKGYAESAKESIIPSHTAFYKGAYEGMKKALTSEFGSEAPQFSDVFKTVTGKDIEEYLPDPESKNFLARHSKMFVNIVADIATDLGIVAGIQALRRAARSAKLAGDVEVADEITNALTKERERLLATMEAINKDKNFKEAGKEYTKVANKAVDNIKRAAEREVKAVAANREAMEHVKRVNEVKKELAQTSKRGMQEAESKAAEIMAKAKAAGAKRKEAIIPEELAAEDDLVATMMRKNDPAGRFAQLDAEAIKGNLLRRRQAEYEADIAKRLEAAKGTYAGKEPDVAAKLEKQVKSLDFPEVKKPKVVSKEKPTVTLESCGLQTAYETVAKCIKKLGGKPKLSDLVQQADDVIPLVEQMFEKAYKTGVFNVSPRKVLSEEAKIAGMTLRKGKGGKGWQLSKRGMREPVQFNNLDEVTQYLGKGDSAEGYAKEVQKFYADVEAHESAKYFNEWAFPSGIENASPRQLRKAVNRLEKQLSKKPTKDKHLLDYYIWSPDAVLGKTPSGRQFYNMVRNARDDADIMTGRGFSRLSKALKDNNISDKNTKLLSEVRKHLDGIETAKNPRARKAAEEIRAILDDVYERALGVGIKPAEYREAYFPHKMLSLDSLKKGPKRDEVLDAVVDEGLFKNRKEAENVLDGFIARQEGNVTDDRFIKWLAQKNNVSLQEARGIYEKGIAKFYSPESGSLMNRRTKNIPWYDRNPISAIGSYLGDANRQISNTQHLGKNNRFARHMLNKIEAEGGNVFNAEEILKRYNRPWDYANKSAWVRRALGFNAVTKLNPVTSFLNLSQSLAATMRTGIGSMVKGLYNFDPQLAQKVGAISQKTMKDVTEMHAGSARWSSRYMGAIGFKVSETVVRDMASNAGQQFAMDLVNMMRSGKRIPFVKRQLNSLGVNADEVFKRGRLTDIELDRISKRISDKTQFRGDILDLPLGWLGPYGRVITQFNTFVYGQAKLIKDHVIGEALAGNFRPLLYLGTVYSAAGVTYDVLVNQALLGKDAPEGPLDWYLQGFTAIGALGMVTSTLTSMKYGEEAIYEQILGPTVSEGVKAAVTTRRLLAGELDDPGQVAIDALMKRAPFVQPLGRRYVRENRSSGYQSYEGY